MKCSKRILKLRTFGDISDVYKPLPTKILQAATSFLHFGLIHWPQRKHLGTCRKKTLKGEDSYPFSNRGSGKLPQMKGNLPFWRYSLNFSRLYNGRKGIFSFPCETFQPPSDTSVSKVWSWVGKYTQKAATASWRFPTFIGQTQLRRSEFQRISKIRIWLFLQNHMFGGSMIFIWWLLSMFLINDYVKKPVIVEKKSSTAPTMFTAPPLFKTVPLLGAVGSINSHYFHGMVINPIIGVYILYIPIKRIPYWTPQFHLLVFFQDTSMVANNFTASRPWPAFRQTPMQRL